VYVNWVRWRNPHNRFRRAVVVLGVNPHHEISLMPELQDQFPALAREDTVLVDRLSRPEVGVGEVGEVAEAGPLSLETVGQFTLSPGFDAGLVVVSDQTFSRLFGSPLREVGLGLVKLREGADAGQVARELQDRLPPDVRVLTRPEAAFREREYWVVNTSTGIIFGCGVVVALLFGAVITYQVLALEVSSRLPEFATLKALGFGHRYVAAIVLQKALFLAVAGYVPGFAIALVVYHLSQSVTNLPGGMTAERAAAVFVLNLSACCLSSLAALRILRRANPVDLFTS
jgi:putative ABC transport system permease protein